jgi:hypothetical protein
MIYITIVPAEAGKARIRSAGASYDAIKMQGYPVMLLKTNIEKITVSVYPVMSMKIKALPRHTRDVYEKTWLDPSRRSKTEMGECAQDSSGLDPRSPQAVLAFRSSSVKTLRLFRVEFSCLKPLCDTTAAPSQRNFGLAA